MISELVPGGNLRDRLEQLGWNPKMGRQFLEDVAAGMAYLHSFNVLHGDLKSLNILIDRGDVAKITDFGLARIREHVSKATNGGGGGLKGTVGFMSPELLDGESLRAPSDVYAFAMVMYEVSVSSSQNRSRAPDSNEFQVVSEGKWPFEGMHQMAIMRKVLDKEERPDRPPNVPDYMWNLMQKCWAQEPEFRPTFPDIVKEMQSWPN